MRERKESFSGFLATEFLPHDTAVDGGCRKKVLNRQIQRLMDVNVLQKGVRCLHALTIVTPMIIPYLLTNEQ